MDDTIDVFFSYSINYVLFHSLTIVYKKIVSRKCGCVVESPNVLKLEVMCIRLPACCVVIREDNNTGNYFIL